TNADLEKMVETSDEWIVTRTGIRERHIAAPNETVATMGFTAAYDGLIPGQESLKVHACVGLPLFAGQNLIGALTLDAMTPEQF
ncbi:hypothetical protein MJM99_34640, partial [Salmonella enterica subsp. enterica serovar Kentucky]|nr:hypothetical protein [Salmonella enterica subsp. enterica serovar Kentucky]